jgi:hypothetical protein
MSTRERIRTLKLYRDFREAEPVGRYVRAKYPATLARMGVCEFIGYMTTHDGETALYVHHFAPGSRPALYAGSGRNKLFLMGGRFTVTDRGITDLDPRGRVVDYTPRYNVASVNRRQVARRKRRG